MPRVAKKVGAHHSVYVVYLRNPRGDGKAVDGAGGVVRVVQVEGPGDVATLRRLDRLQSLATG